MLHQTQHLCTILPAFLEAGDDRALTPNRSAAGKNLHAKWNLPFKLQFKPRHALQVLSANHVLVFDTGSAADKRALCRALRREGVRPSEVTDVVLSHHHPDHIGNVGLFKNARLYMGINTQKGHE